MSNPTRRSQLIKTIAIAAMILPTVLLQAQSSQAIPLDDILDAAGKSFLQKLFGGGAPNKPAESAPAASSEADNSQLPASTSSTVDERVSTNK
jgi:hypothetical protein